MGNPMIEILKNPLSVRKQRYGTTDIDKLIIDGNVFTGFKTFSSFWEKTYVEQPERSASGVIDNLNDYATFTTFIVKVNFAMMSIDDYRRLYDLFLSKNEFVVTAYNVLTNNTYTCKMYFAPDQMPKLYAVARRLQGEKYLEVLGIQDYTIELIGTNAELDKISVLYYDRNGNVIGSKGTYAGTQYLLGEGITVADNSGYVFNGTWVRGKLNGNALPNNQAVNATLDTTTELNSRTIKWYAQYDTNKQYNLSFSYGLGEPLKDFNGKDITSIKFIANQDNLDSAISNANITLYDGSKFTALPTSPSPKYKDTQYDTHTNEGWRKGNSIKYDEVWKYDLLSIENDIIYYQVFEPVKKSITFNSNGGTTYNKLENVPYGEKVAIPTPYKEGNTFGGWYLDENFENGFDGIMLPYDITLYAKWE